MGSGESVQSINDNLVEALGAFAFTKLNGGRAVLTGAALARSEVRYGLFNTATLCQPSGAGLDFDASVSASAHYFKSHHLPWSYWYCEELLDADTRRRARMILSTRGLRAVMDMPGMIADKLLPPARNLPQLDFRRVGDIRTRNAFAEIMSSAFQVKPDLAFEVYGSEFLWQHDMIGWIGYHRSRPVTTTAVTVAGGSIGIYAVGTPPEYQRRGFAEAIIRHALSEARRQTGIERTVLQSSVVGYALYLRMGYRQTSRYVVYAKYD
jgi:ribosomal protein S18 acetylase RimI-like enzyme